MEMYHTLNGAVSLLVATALTYVVLSLRYNEGVIIKFGLITMIFSLLATAYFTLSGHLDWGALWNAGTTLRTGILIVIVGYFVRAHAAGSPLRRSTDWGDLDDAVVDRR